MVAAGEVSLWEALTTRIGIEKEKTTHKSSQTLTVGNSAKYVGRWDIQEPCLAFLEKHRPLLEKAWIPVPPTVLHPDVEMTQVDQYYAAIGLTVFGPVNAACSAIGVSCRLDRKPAASLCSSFACWR